MPSLPARGSAHVEPSSSSSRRPLPITAGHCHCTRCRRLRAGTPWSTNGMVPADSVALLAGQDSLRYWRPPDGLPKAFCADCGGHVFSGEPGVPETRSVGVRFGALHGDPGDPAALAAVAVVGAVLVPGARRRPPALRREARDRLRFWSNRIGYREVPVPPATGVVRRRAAPRPLRGRPAVAPERAPRGHGGVVGRDPRECLRARSALSPSPPAGCWWVLSSAVSCSGSSARSSMATAG